MNLGIVLYVQSILILLIGLLQAFPLAFSIYYAGNDTIAFVESISITIFIGLILNIFTKSYRKKGLKARESFAIITFSWIVAALFATMPFLLHAYSLDYSPVGTINNFTDAYFEMMSGFTTTGSTILTNIESLPHGLLFWRSLTHWIGGMGIILLAVAILPALGIGGMQLYQAEVPSPIADKLAPRISQTAKILWGVYLVFTIIETIFLMYLGMSFFDALSHTFATIATGGFSPKNTGLGFYNSVDIDIVITFFMFLSGASFALHYRVLILGGTSYLKNREFRIYLLVVIFVTAIITFVTYEDVFDGDIFTSLRYVLFQVVSIMTTTGFSIGVDERYHFAVWSSFAQFAMLILMFVGASAGSTSGGFKILRVYLIFKFVYIELVKFVYPRHIKLVRVGKDVVPDAALLSTLGFIMLYFIVMFTAILAINLFEGDLVDSFTAVLATLNNIGPGLGKVGPDGSFAHISTASKWVLTVCMLLGRLEFYGALILFLPFTWERAKQEV